jgi:hypothetical protein
VVVAALVADAAVAVVGAITAAEADEADGNGRRVDM